MVLSKIKEGLLKLFLFPVNFNFRLAMSVRNRILPDYQHLAALQLIIKEMNRNSITGKLILDIGCFEGGSSVFFSKKIKNAHVIGFEANPEAYEKAKRFTGNMPHIKIENFAVSDSNGFADLYVTDNKVSSSLNPIKGEDLRFRTKDVQRVNTITLDNYMEEKDLNDENVLAIKLDVQGHELKVLKGAVRTLAKTYFVLTEMSNHAIYEGGARYFEVDSLLREEGFVLQNIFASFTYEKRLYEYDALYINSGLFKKEGKTII